MIRNKTLCLLERLKDRVAVIVLTLQSRVQVLSLQTPGVFVLLLSESFGFFDVHPVLPVYANFKFSVMLNVFKSVLGIASVY